MTRTARRVPLKGACIIGFVLALTFPPCQPLWAATITQLSWSPNTEPDLGGYRLRYGTTPGIYTQTAPDIGKSATSYAISGLDANLTYYFVLHAFDNAGNVSLPSNEASGKPTVLVGPAPTISSAVEVASDSIYILQSGHHQVRVAGSNFQSGAVVNLGTDVSEGATSLTGSTQITLTIDVGAAAVLGPRTLTVSNPDGGTGNRTSALTVVKTADIDRDCLLDAGDLNAIARAWNTTSTSPAFNPDADLNGDGTLDGDDLVVLEQYFGLRLSVCP